jgi:hypothetical protein
VENQKLVGEKRNFPFLKPPRPKFPRTQGALDPRRATAERSTAATDCEPLADLRFHATTNSVFPEGNVVGVMVAARASSVSAAAAIESSCGDR